MNGADVLLGLILSRIFGRGDVARRPAEVNVGPAPAPGPGPSPSPSPTPTPAPVPAPFPSDVVVPPPTPSPAPAPGFRKAVEVWQIKPEFAQAATNIVGALGPEVVPLTVPMLEQQFPRGWQAAKTVTAAEQAQAVELLKSWVDGRVVFMGPNTPQGRRAFRNTKHPASAPKPAPAPGPSPLPLPPGPAPQPSPVPSGQVLTVRKGEGLAQVAKRVGKPENATSAKELRAANIPQGPDAKWEAASLNAGGIK